MRRTWKCHGASLLLAAALVIPSAACGPQGEPDRQPGAPEATAAGSPDMRPAGGTEIPERVKRAAAVARAIQDDPGSAESILASEGMTREEFEDLLYEIAAEPALSEAYLRELGR